MTGSAPERIQVPPRQRGPDLMTDTGENDLFDEVMLDEIELLTEIVIVATASAGRLAPAQIDEILGVEKLSLVAVSA